MSLRVVITGFGPFPGAPFNPSAAVAKALARRRRPAVAGIERTVHIFATAYAAIDRELPKLLASAPDIVLLFGLAGRRRHICIETRARNAVSVLLPDAGKFRPQQGVIALAAPPARQGRAPFARLAAAARHGTVAVRLSQDAGRYVCNYAYWRALEAPAAKSQPLIQFVHIPAVNGGSRPRRGSRRAPSLQQIIRAGENLLIALIAAAKH